MFLKLNHCAINKNSKSSKILALDFLWPVAAHYCGQTWCITLSLNLGTQNGYLGSHLTVQRPNPFTKQPQYAPLCLWRLHGGCWYGMCSVLLHMWKILMWGMVGWFLIRVVIRLKLFLLNHSRTVSCCKAMDLSIISLQYSYTELS